MERIKCITFSVTQFVTKFTQERLCKKRITSVPVLGLWANMIL